MYLIIHQILTLKKCTAHPHFFLFTDVILASENPSQRIMIIDDKIRDEKLQYDINKEEAKILALSYGKFNKYEYLTGEEIPPSNRK